MLARSLPVPSMLASSIHFGLLASIQSVSLFAVGGLTDPSSRPKSAAQLTSPPGSPVASRYWSPVCSPGNTCCWSIVGNQFLYFSGPQFLCCIIIQWQPPVSMSPQTSLLASSPPALLPASSSDHPSASTPALLPPDCSPELMSPASRVVQPTTLATRSSSGGTPCVQSSSCPSSSCSALLVIPLPSNQEAGLKDATG